MNANKSQHIVQNNSGITFSVNQANQISRIWFEKIVVNNIEITKWYGVQIPNYYTPNNSLSKIVPGSLLSLNDPNNILAVTENGKIIVVYKDAQGFHSNHIFPNPNETSSKGYYVYPKSLRLSLIENITYGVVKDYRKLYETSFKPIIDANIKNIFTHESGFMNSNFTPIKGLFTPAESQMLAKYFYNGGNNPNDLSYELKIKMIEYSMNKNPEYIDNLFGFKNEIFYTYWENNWKIGIIARENSLTLIDPSTFNIAYNGTTLQIINSNGDIEISNNSNNGTVIKGTLIKSFMTLKDTVFTSIDENTKRLIV